MFCKHEVVLYSNMVFKVSNFAQYGASLFKEKAPMQRCEIVVTSHGLYNFRMTSGAMKIWLY